MQGVKDASLPYEVEHRAYHAVRPGFRSVELHIGPAQKVPRHYHNNLHDTFYAVAGSIRIFLRDPKERDTADGGRKSGRTSLLNSGDTSAVCSCYGHRRIRFCSLDPIGLKRPRLCAALLAWSGHREEGIRSTTAARPTSSSLSR